MLKKNLSLEEYQKILFKLILAHFDLFWPIFGYLGGQFFVLVIKIIYIDVSKCFCEQVEVKKLLSNEFRLDFHPFLAILTYFGLFWVLKVVSN